MVNLIGWKSRKHIRQFMTRAYRIETTSIEQQLQVNALKSTTEYVEKNMMSAARFGDRFDLIHHALTLSKPNGLHLEFGVHKGKSINFTAQRVSSTVHGFDSFEGLPESWRPGYPKGTFDLSKTGLPKVRKNVELHRGWFDTTLAAFTQGLAKDAFVSYVHIDCDLYSSTKTIFNLLAPYIGPGTVILFDEYFNHSYWEDGEYKAFQEFIESSGLSYQYAGFNKFGEQVCVQITASQAGAIAA
jgi:hypothetical protein